MCAGGNVYSSREEVEVIFAQGMELHFLPWHIRLITIWCICSCHLDKIRICYTWKVERPPYQHCWLPTPLHCCTWSCKRDFQGSLLRRRAITGYFISGFHPRIVEYFTSLLVSLTNSCKCSPMPKVGMEMAESQGGCRQGSK